MKRSAILMLILGTIIMLSLVVFLVVNKITFNESPIKPYESEFFQSAEYNLHDIQEYLDKAEQDPERTQVVSLESLQIPHNFISSSIGIGDLSGKKDNIYLRFDREIIGNESLDNFRKYSSPRDTAINILLKDGGQVSVADESVRDNNKIVFTSYEDGILSGILVTKPSYSFVSIRDNSNAECITGDMLGICNVNTPIDLNLIVKFKVRVNNF